MEMLAEAKAEIDQYGPNPGADRRRRSTPRAGRAIELLQAAGIAELGPYFIAYQDLEAARLPRGVVRRADSTGRRSAGSASPTTRTSRSSSSSTAGRWTRRRGFPVAINQLGALDVDIILAEGPNGINTMSRRLRLAGRAGEDRHRVPPELIVELSTLPAIVKKRAMAHLIAGAAAEAAWTSRRWRSSSQQESARAQEIAAHAELYVAQAQEALAKAATAGMPDRRRRRRAGAPGRHRGRPRQGLARPRQGARDLRRAAAAARAGRVPGRAGRGREGARDQAQTRRTRSRPPTSRGSAPPSRPRSRSPSRRGATPMTRSLVSGIENKRAHRRVVPAAGRSAAIGQMNPGAGSAPLALMAAHSLGTALLVLDFRLPGSDPVAESRAVLKPAPLDIGQGCCGSLCGGREGEGEGETKCAHGVK